MKLVIDTWKQDDCTTGRLRVIEGTTTIFQCMTLELPWADNEPNISCVPADTYMCKRHQSPSLGNVFWLYDVENRTWIYIHKGNFTNQIAGCILVGMTLGYIDSDTIPDVGRSADAFDKLWKILPDEFEVTIFRS